MNEQIRAREVRVIGDNGEQLGIMSVQEALRSAREQNTDLVEVAPTAVPPVCRLLDYGRFKYEQAKKEREARKHQRTVVVREIRFRPRIDEHDFDFKVKQAHRHLEDGDKVKASVLFRGREMVHPELGQVILHRVIEQLKDVGSIEKPLQMEGRNMNIILAPAAVRPQKTLVGKQEA
ncbi:MAG TPA: translation initiation factor IF-3 [Dehalococcoidia bacterium]|nr:translation initiation factor IF-3 [Dehalococcoidia bacterium]